LEPATPDVEFFSGVQMAEMRGCKIELLMADQFRRKFAALDYPTASVHEFHRDLKRLRSIGIVPFIVGPVKRLGETGIPRNT
jgi:hypothetical protein